MILSQKEQKCAGVIEELKGVKSLFKHSNFKIFYLLHVDLINSTVAHYPLQQHFLSKVVEVKWYIPTLHFPVDRRRNGSNRILH